MEVSDVFVKAQELVGPRITLKVGAAPAGEFKAAFGAVRTGESELGSTYEVTVAPDYLEYLSAEEVSYAAMHECSHLEAGSAFLAALAFEASIENTPRKGPLGSSHPSSAELANQAMENHFAVKAKSRQALS